MVEQTNTMAEYNFAFVEKTNPLGEIPKKFLMGVSFKGLEENVKRELRLFEPISLDHVMSLEVKINLKQNPKPLNTHQFQNPQNTPKRQVSHLRPPPVHLPISTKTPIPFQNSPKLSLLTSHFTFTKNLFSPQPTLPTHDH